MPTPHDSGPSESIVKSGLNRIDALLLSRKWGNAGTGKAATVTYSIPSSSSIWDNDYNNGSWTEREPYDFDLRYLTASEASRFEQALKKWAEMANIKLQKINETTTLVGDIRVAYSGVVEEEGSIAWAYSPGGGPTGGDVWLNPFDKGLQNALAPGGDGFHTLLHELGHALGLAHPFDGKDRLPNSKDNAQYTVMSYDKHPSASIFPTTPMLYDIAAIQYVYGANMNTRKGNTRYRFSARRETLKTIWDAGGRDTIDVSNQRYRAVLNLRQGTFSSIGRRNEGGKARNNLALAYGVKIEDAVGSRYADTIKGNSLKNRLYGGKGGDILRGKSGGDRLVGQAGSDRLDGGPGFDTLIGGAGNDVLSGGGGADRYAYNERGEGVDRITDFNRSQNDKLTFRHKTFARPGRGRLKSWRFSANKQGLASDAGDRFVFNTSNHTLWFDPDGSGARAPVRIATLSNGVRLRASDILIT